MPTLLIISNIILLIGLFYYSLKTGLKIKFTTFNNILTILLPIAVLAYITVKLPKLRERGSTLYDISYLVIITVVSIMTSYFDDSIDMSQLFGPYLEMFKELCVILVFLLLSTKLKSLRKILYGKHSLRHLIVCIVIFSLLGLYSSKFHINVDGSPANVRCLIVMISGLFGGPFVGLPVGLITGIYRYSLGGLTALPCAISTVLSGIVGSLIYVLNDKKFPKPIHAIVLMFLFTGFEMLMLFVLSPPEISFKHIRDIYPIMLFASVIGIALFSIVIKEEREKMNSENNDELGDNDEIKFLKSEIKELKGKTEKLKNETKGLKNETEELKSYNKELKNIIKDLRNE